MKRTNVKLGLFALLSVMFFTSCTKNTILKNFVSEENPSGKDVPVYSSSTFRGIENQEGMLVFQSVDQLFELANKLEEFSDEERLMFEKTHSFESFGTLADKFYCSVNFEAISSIEELEVLKKEHGYWVEVDYDDKIENEPSVFPADLSMIERWIMNKDKMYIVGKDVYKHFNDGMVAVTPNEPSNVKRLINTDYSSWKELLKDDNFIVYKYEDDEVPAIAFVTSYSDVQPSAPSQYKKIKFNGYNDKYRMRVILTCKRITHMRFFGTSEYRLRTKSTIINERKGTWLWIFTKWYNEYHYTLGNITLHIDQCLFDPKYRYRRDQYDFHIKVDENIKSKTFTAIHGIQPKNYQFVNAPWIRIIGAKVSLKASNGTVIEETR